MNLSDFQTMSIDDLWALHEKVGLLLSAKLESEKRLLQQRLDELSRKAGPSLTQN